MREMAAIEQLLMLHMNQPPPGVNIGMKTSQKTQEKIKTQLTSNCQL